MTRPHNAILKYIRKHGCPDVFFTVYEWLLFLEQDENMIETLEHTTLMSSFTYYYRQGYFERKNIKQTRHVTGTSSIYAYRLKKEFKIK